MIHIFYIAILRLSIILRIGTSGFWRSRQFLVLQHDSVVFDEFHEFQPNLLIQTCLSPHFPRQDYFIAEVIGDRNTLLSCDRLTCRMR
ncbi:MULTISPECIES: hypothetical protein [Spirulina sp. CCY15215]|uniref:hypothetical protein n=1 Tax=Spirulina sp. CCY15215 TaxID=2767591 RepID=UPI00195121C6|nr:hypothetical protein [Spirulina major]